MAPSKRTQPKRSGKRRHNTRSTTTQEEEQKQVDEEYADLPATAVPNMEEEAHQAFTAFAPVVAHATEGSEGSEDHEGEEEKSLTSDINSTTTVEYDDDESTEEGTPPMPIPSLNPGAAFRWILQHRIGLVGKEQIYSITHIAGIKRIHHLRFMTEEVLVESLASSVTGMARLRLMALRRFSQDQWKNFGVIDIEQFTRPKMDELLGELAKGKRPADTKPRSTSAAKDSDLKRFSGKPEHWQEAKTSLVTHLNTMRNDSGIPLYYVIRDPEDEKIYRQNAIGNKIYDAIQSGKGFEDDSFQVAQVLKKWTAGGTAVIHTDEQGADGVTMWQQLILAYEGTDARINAVAHAKSKISTARFDKWRHTFTFDNYCDLHIKNNRILTYYGENQTRTSK